MSRIRVWMDIDGVLNLLEPSSRMDSVEPTVELDTGVPWAPEDMVEGPTVSRREARRRREERTQRLPIRIDRDNAERLDHLLSRNVSVEWTTTWNDMAPTLFADLLGVGHDWPVNQVSSVGMFGKFPSLIDALERAFDSGDSVLWIDDDPGRPGHNQKIRSHPSVAPAVADKRFKLLSPSPRLGLGHVWNDVVETLDTWGA